MISSIIWNYDAQLEKPFQQFFHLPDLPSTYRLKLFYYKDSLYINGMSLPGSGLPPKLYKYNTNIKQWENILITGAINESYIKLRTWIVDAVPTNNFEHMFWIRIYNNKTRPLQTSALQILKANETIITRLNLTLPDSRGFVVNIFKIENGGAILLYYDQVASRHIYYITYDFKNFNIVTDFNYNTNERVRSYHIFPILGQYFVSGYLKPSITYLTYNDAINEINGITQPTEVAKYIEGNNTILHFGANKAIVNIKSIDQKLNINYISLDTDDRTILLNTLEIYQNIYDHYDISYKFQNFGRILHVTENYISFCLTYQINGVGDFLFDIYIGNTNYEFRQLNAHHKLIDKPLFFKNVNDSLFWDESLQTLHYVGYITHEVYIIEDLDLGILFE